MIKQLLTAFVASSMVAGLSAEVKISAIPVGEKPATTIKKSVTANEVLVYENFDKWTSGSAVEPDYDQPLAPYYPACYIDPSLMNDDAQWSGFQVYSAGGVCAFRSYDPTVFAKLNTPKGDYSGSIKVTFLAKYMPVSYINSEGVEIMPTGTSVSLGLYTDDDCQFQLGENDGPSYNLLGNLRLYPHFGWYEVTVEFDNYTACNDAYLTFFTTDGLLLDDIKVTSNNDKFIASPIIEGISDVTETSFTVNFQPVKKSFNYYAYLYELRGYNEDTGEPIYIPVPEPEAYESIQEYFGPMTYEEYWGFLYGVEDFDSPWYLSEPYTNYGTATSATASSYTFEGLDPSKQYYFAICSHYVYSFSPQVIFPMNEIAAPVISEASDIKNDSFKANWNSVAKADSYQVNLYGVNKVVEDTEDYIIFEEDFTNVSGYADSSDIYNPDVVDPESGLGMDELTSTPGWSVPLEHVRLVKGMLGLDGRAWLSSPELYVAGSDKISVSLKAKFDTEDAEFYVEFAGVQYSANATGFDFDEVFELNTNGMDVSQLKIGGKLFIDEIIISQNLKAGAYTYTFMGSDVTEDTDYSFTDIDSSLFDYYGYSVQSIKGEGAATVYSAPSERMIVDLKNGGSFSGVADIDTLNNEYIFEMERYSIDGKRISSPMKGINIIKMSDGSIRKVMVK